MLIHLLSEETINQIAAGEVVENPASAIKELVENSLDAAASEIVVEIVGGGFQLIRISDNGCGMDREDALLSIKRHATSKISRATDLFHLTTLGFRGEALAAISAISHFTLTTAASNGPATQIEVEGGELRHCEIAAHSQGTTIEARSLFYNVPARMKFQKGAHASAAEIHRMIALLALGNPGIRFKLISNGKISIDVPREQTLLSRGMHLLGNEFISSGIEVHNQMGALSLNGVLAAPQNHRVNRSGQYLFINGRSVFCSLVNDAIKEAYGTRLPNNRFPCFLLHLKLPADLIDVNIHPQKREIKLRDERFFREKIQEIIANALRDSTPSRLSESAPSKMLFAPLFDKDISSALKFQEPMISQPQPQLDLPKTYQAIGLFAHYLLLEGASVNMDYDGILIVDLNAARSRLIFDGLCSENSSREKQGLLLPFTLELSNVESAMILSNLEVIEALGFCMRPLGKNIFIVEAIPSFMDEAEVKQVMRIFASELQIFIGKGDIEKQRERHLALLALRFAKMKKEYSMDEAFALFGQLLSSNSPQLSPHGKPTMVHINKDAIQKYFA